MIYIFVFFLGVVKLVYRIPVLLSVKSQVMSKTLTKIT